MLGLYFVYTLLHYIYTFNVIEFLTFTQSELQFSSIVTATSISRTNEIVYYIMYNVVEVKDNSDLKYFFF